MRSDRIASIVRVALVLPLTLSCAACLASKPAHSNLKPSKVDAHMHDATTDPSPSGSAGAIAPDTITRDLLKYIVSTRTERDLERSRFWAAMRLPPAELSDTQFFEEEDGYQAFTQELKNTQWSYTVSFSEGTDEVGSRAVRLVFDHPDNRVQNTGLDLGPICGIDLDGFRNELTHAGFLEGPPEPSRFEYEGKGAMSVTFTRGDIHVVLATQQEAALPVIKRAHACVLSVEARAFPNAQTDKASR